MASKLYRSMTLILSASKGVIAYSNVYLHYDKNELFKTLYDEAIAKYPDGVVRLEIVEFDSDFVDLIKRWATS